MKFIPSILHYTNRTFYQMLSATILLCCPASTLMAEKMEGMTYSDHSHPGIIKNIVNEVTTFIAPKKITYDTLYIQKPPYDWTIRLRFTGNESSIRLKGDIDDKDVLCKLAAHINATVGMGINYKGLGVGLSVNSKMFNKENRKDINLGIRFYSSRFGIEALYQSTKTYSGNVKINGTEYPTQSGEIDYNSLTFDAYYVFNHKHFSFPAAFTQSYIQRRSSGSIMLGASALLGEFKTIYDGNDPDYIHYRTGLNLLAIGAGYGYNIVLGKHFLIHFSLVPNIIIINGTHCSANNKSRQTDKSFPDFIITGRNAFVYTNKRFFASFTNTYNQYYFDRNENYNKYSKYTGRINIGYRL